METNERHIIDELNKQTTPLPSDAYFAQLKSEVLAKAGASAEPGHHPPASSLKGGGKIVPLYRKRRTLIAIATAAAGVILIVTLFLPNDQPAPPTAQQPDWNSVSREDVLAYIDDNIDQFEAEAIAAHLDSLPSWSVETASAATTIAVNGRGQSKYDDLFDDIEKEDILEYLQDEAIELDDEQLGY